MRLLAENEVVFLAGMRRHLLLEYYRLDFGV